MNILVTGGAGFIGSHIVDLLIKNNYKVIIVDNLITGNKNNINPEAKFYNIDIRNNELEKVFLENKINYVIHEAAQVSVGASIKDPYYDMTENIAGTINLLNLCKKHNIQKFVAASSAAVYAQPEYLPVDEKHKVDFLSFYGLSKYTMENYVKLFGIDYILLRYSNVYGPRQDANGEAGVVSIFIDRMSENKPIEIHGDGEQTRDFVFVKDVAAANLACILTKEKNQIINVSTNQKISINDLYSKIKEMTCYSKQPDYTEERTGDIKHSILDNQKAKNVLSWQDKIALHEGIKETVEWKKSILNN